MKKMDKLKLAGIGAAVLGIGATIVSNIVNDKQTKAEIAKQVSEQVAEQLKDR